MPWFSAEVMVRLDRLIVTKMVLTFLGGGSASLVGLFCSFCTTRSARFSKSFPDSEGEAGGSVSPVFLPVLGPSSESDMVVFRRWSWIPVELSWSSLIDGRRALTARDWCAHVRRQLCAP